MNELQEQLVAMVRENIEEYWGEGAFEAAYLQDHGACVPEQYIGEDLCKAICDKFYAVFSAIARVVEKKDGMAFVFTTVASSCEDTTRVILHGYYEDRKEVLLLVERIKAWNLWWPSEEEMGEDLERWYNEARKNALEVRPREIAISQGRPPEGFRLYQFTILFRDGEWEYLSPQVVAAKSPEQAEEFAQEYCATFYEAAQWDEGEGAWYHPKGYPAWRVQWVRELARIVAPIASGRGTATFKVRPVLGKEN